jgi:CRISPR/Cas system-associated exonuclease Cas4 (RecB family)
MQEVGPSQPIEPPFNGDVTDAIVSAVSQQQFHEWFEEKQTAENVLNGQTYFNRPARPKPAEQHSPSQLLQCQRKMNYRRQNAPREGEQPDGIFWVGSEVEDDLVVPFLRDVATTPDTYIGNSLWVDCDVDTGQESLRIRGATDPAVVTATGEPLVVFEVKTTTSTQHITSPKPHHRAQLHAYLYGLDQKYDHAVCDGVVLYLDRESLDLKAFHEPFDPEFWESVTEWMQELTHYEAADDLPPAQPKYDWECKYCDFRNRCGKGDSSFADIGPDGLLPLFTAYDRANLVEYLDAHENAQLTPTLAHEHPALAAEHGSYDWRCTTCQETFHWQAIEPDEETNAPPYCPTCVKDGDLCVVRGPEPSEQ